MYKSGKKSKFKHLIIWFLASISSGTADYVKTFDHMEFRANPEDSSIVAFLTDAARKQQSELETFFGGGPRRRVLIRLAASDAEYTRLAGGRIPEWSGAVTFPGQRIILLKPGAYFDPDMYREILIHELVHIYIGDFFPGDALPLWMVEGCAMQLSKKSLTWNEMIVLGNAISGDQVPALTEIDYLLRFGQAKAAVAYLESYTAVRYLVESYGAEKFRAILRDRSAGGDIDAVFIKHLNIGISEFEDAWYRSMQDRFTWTIFLQTENIFWLLLVMICIAAFIIIRIRNRRIVRNWQESDENL